MTVSEDPLAWEGLAFSKHIAVPNIYNPPQEVRNDSATFGDYVWLVQGYYEPEKYLDDTIVPLLCCTCFKLAVEQALNRYYCTYGTLKFQSVMVFRYPRETMRNQNEIRRPRREELEKLVVKALRSAKKPRRKYREPSFGKEVCA